MPKLPTISGKELVGLLEKNGFKIKRTSGSHFLMCNSHGKRTTIPIHENKDIPRGTLKAILRDIEITTEQFVEMIDG